MATVCTCNLPKVKIVNTCAICNKNFTYMADVIVFDGKNAWCPTPGHRYTGPKLFGSHDRKTCDDCSLRGLTCYEDGTMSFRVINERTGEDIVGSVNPWIYPYLTAEEQQMIENRKNKKLKY